MFITVKHPLLIYKIEVRKWIISRKHAMFVKQGILLICKAEARKIGPYTGKNVS